MNLKKLKLQLEVLFSPKLWYRIAKVNKEYDTWLWDKMEEGCHRIEPYMFREQLCIKSKCSVLFAGKQIWIVNAPYADGTYDPVRNQYYFMPSRTTALRFRKMYDAYIQEQTKRIEKELYEN